MTAPLQTAGVLATPAAFFNCVFDPLQPLVDALVEDAQTAFGHEFKPADVRWHEATPDGNSIQWCRLIWQGKVLLELQISASEMLSHCLVEWSTLRH